MLLPSCVLQCPLRPALPLCAWGTGGFGELNASVAIHTAFVDRDLKGRRRCLKSDRVVLKVLRHVNVHKECCRALLVCCFCHEPMSQGASC